MGMLIKWRTAYGALEAEMELELPHTQSGSTESSPVEWGFGALFSFRAF